MINKKLVALLSMGLFMLSTAWGQKKNIIVFDQYANIIYSAKNRDSLDLYKLKMKDFKPIDTVPPVPNGLPRIHLYFGTHDLDAQLLKKMICNSIWFCEFIPGQRLSDMPHNEYDTLCYPTGIDSVPDGFWLHGYVTKANEIKYYNQYSVVGYKINGLKLKYILENDTKLIRVDTVIYNHGYIRYKSSFEDANNYSRKTFNTCGKVVESEYYEDGKLTLYENANAGYGISLDENGIITEIWTIRKNVMHGMLHKFDEKGKYIKSRKYEYGKRVEE